MRRKLLSLVTVLCMVLGMLPATAMAIDASNIDKTDEENVMVIVEDTELTGTIEKLILVDAAVEVDVTDATLAVGLVVSPDAAGAEVVLNGVTAAEVVVLADATVKTDETTTVELVTVDAAGVDLEIAGTASITLTKNAVSVTVITAKTSVVSLDVAKGAAVTVNVAAGAEVTVTAADLDAVALTGEGAASAEVEEVGVDTEDPEDGEEDEEEPKDTEEPGDTTVPGEEFVTDTPVIGGETESGETPAAPPSYNITWGTIDMDDSSEHGTVEATKTSVSITGNVTVDANGKYWIGFSIPEGYNVVIKTNSDVLEAKLDDVNGFIYFDITAQMEAALLAAEEAAKADPGETAQTVQVEGKVTVEDDITITVTVVPEDSAAPDADAEDIEITVTVEDVTASKDVEVPAADPNTPTTPETPETPNTSEE